MKLGISAAAESRNFSRKFHRARTKFGSLVEQFSQLKLINPIHDAILVGVTDSLPPSHFVEVKNTDGFFQILAGVDGELEQEKLEESIFSIIQRAIQACPFSTPDRHQFVDLALRWHEANLGCSESQRD
jgi:hypothetical protein